MIVLLIVNKEPLTRAFLEYNVYNCENRREIRKVLLCKVFKSFTGLLICRIPPYHRYVTCILVALVLLSKKNAKNKMNKIHLLNVNS